VYGSAFITDDEAREEFLRKNPKVDVAETRIVKFRSGRYERTWVGNVVAIGNSSGFVEPLESTALQTICVEASSLADSLIDCSCEPTPTLIKLYNRYNAEQWDDIRNFLAVHYKFNTRCDTPFWRAARSDVALHGAQDIVDWYQENGPSTMPGIVLVHPTNSFRLDGFIALLVGQKVPYKTMYNPTPAEQEFWRNHRAQLAVEAQYGMTSEEALYALRTPGLKWADPNSRPVANRKVPRPRMQAPVHPNGPVQVQKRNQM
jgi:tryptophan halogenase